MDHALVSRQDIGSLTGVLASGWWIFLLRGLAALVFGGVAVLWPSLALSTITVAFGLYALVDAAAALGSLLLGQANWKGRWWLGPLALAWVAAGLAAFLWPDLAALALIYAIAGWACVSGVLQLTGAVALRPEMEDEWLLMLSGAISVLFGALLFALSSAGLATLTLLVGLYSIAYGATVLGAAAVLRSKLSA